MSLFWHKNGTMGLIDGVCPCDYGYDARAEIIGTKGVILIGELYNNTSIICTKDKGIVSPQILSWKNRFIWFGSSLVILTIYGLILTIIKGTLPFIDSATTVFSIIATIMLNKRLTEQWFFWIMVDVLSIVMWAYIFITSGGDVSILVMWSAFLVNAVYGYYNWRKLERK